MTASVSARAAKYLNLAGACEKRVMNFNEQEATPGCATAPVVKPKGVRARYQREWPHASKRIDSRLAWFEDSNHVGAIQPWRDRSLFGPPGSFDVCRRPSSPLAAPARGSAAGGHRHGSQRDHSLLESVRRAPLWVECFRGDREEHRRRSDARDR